MKKFLKKNNIIKYNLNYLINLFFCCIIYNMNLFKNFLIYYLLILVFYLTFEYFSQYLIY